MVASLDQDHAFAVEGAPLRSFVRFVAAGVAVADAGDPGAPAYVKAYQVIGGRNEAALRVQDLYGNRNGILAVGGESRAIRCQAKLRRRAGCLDGIGGDHAACTISPGLQSARRVGN